MNCAGITRRMDKIGRLQISTEIRREMGIADASLMKISAEDDKIVLTIGWDNRERKGYLRHIDALGRITVPSAIRRMLGIQEGDMMEFFADGAKIIAAKIDAGCLHEECCERMIANLDRLDIPVRAKVYQLVSEIRTLVRPKADATQNGRQRA